MTVRYTYGKRKQFKIGVASKIASQRRDALTKEIEETLGGRTLSEVIDEEYRESQVANSPSTPGSSVTEALNTLSASVTSLNTRVGVLADKSWIVGDRSAWSTNGTGEIHSVIILSNDRCAVEYQDGTPPWILTRAELEKRFTRCSVTKFPRVHKY
jgi:hypothetical protein